MKNLKIYLSKVKAKPKRLAPNQWYILIRITSNFCQSSEYESDSDEEPQVEFRPVFVPKYVLYHFVCNLVSSLIEILW